MFSMSAGSLRLILFCWIVICSVSVVLASDEIEQMLSIETSSVPAVEKTATAAVDESIQSEIEKIKLQAVEKPVQKENKEQSPVKVAVPPVQVKQVKAPVQSSRNAETPKIALEKPAGSTRLPVVSPPKKDVSVSLEAAAVPVPVAVDYKPEAIALRAELRLREQELAKANEEVGRLKTVVAKIREASRRESLVFHYNMAAIYRSNMMYKKAEEEYLKSIAIDPNDAGVHYNLAILYDDNFKDKKKAKQHYQRFLELAPEDPDAPKVQEWLSSIL